MTDFDRSIRADFYPGANLPTVPPILSSSLRIGLEYQTQQQVELWSVYSEAEPVIKALIKSIVHTNLVNVTKHVKDAGDRDVRNADANMIARGSRPQAVLLLDQSEGIDSVELIARLVSGKEEPHNALSTVMAKQALQLILQDENWQKPFGESPRSRLKVTRLFPMVDSRYAVVQTKLDHADIENAAQSDSQFVVKGRRSGFIQLDSLPPDVRTEVIRLTDLHHGTIADADESKNIVAEYLRTEPEGYQAVIDRAYAARVRLGQPTNS